MKMGKLYYFSEFLLFPPLIVVAMLLAIRITKHSSPVVLAMVYCIGFGSWTLIEYLLHRVFFHHAPILAQIHERHHVSPNDLIGTPAWVSICVCSLAVAGPSLAVLGVALGITLVAGLVTGYLSYVFVHYTTHHWLPRRGSYLYRARLRHSGHHHSSHNGNFGVTTEIWDRVFGTVIHERSPTRSCLAGPQPSGAERNF
jgi:sterol desaturase/sphingolipid hydroxylase (fatty acid hydroxylase superfamily)